MTLLRRLMCWEQCGRVEKRSSRKAHNLEIVGSTPTSAPILANTPKGDV